MFMNTEQEHFYFHNTEQTVYRKKHIIYRKRQFLFQTKRPETDERLNPSPPTIIPHILLPSKYM